MEGLASPFCPAAANSCTSAPASGYKQIGHTTVLTPRSRLGFLFVHRDRSAFAVFPCLGSNVWWLVVMHQAPHSFCPTLAQLF